MALHTKKDFAEICGVELKDLYIYIRRKKVVCTGEYVNDTDEVNALFLEKRKAKGKIKEKKKVSSAPVVEKKIIETPEISNDEKSESREPLTLIQLEREKKLADLAKVEADTVYRQLQIDKMTGTSIPTELVKNVVSSLSKSFVAGFKDGADGFLIEISKRFGISNSDLAGLRGKLVEIINGSIKKSVDQSRRDLKKITDNYSAKREVGEHD